jgi:hypothetical protein
MKPLFEGHQWPRKPLWGYVNEADPYVMEMEIEAAAAHGVNVFIYDWYWFDNRPFLENCLNDGYLKARNNDKVKFYLMWANHDADTSWDKRFSDRHILLWDGAVSMRTFEYLIDRTIDKYFTHPSYYKINGKPVYMIYHLPNLRAMGLAGDHLPSRILRHPKHMLGCVFVAVFLETLPLGNKFVVALLKAVANIFKENKHEHHILIFRCREIATKFIGTVPNAVFNRLLFHYFCFLGHSMMISFCSNR